MARKRTTAQKQFVDGNGIRTEDTRVNWKPHNLRHDTVVAVRYHISPSGIGIKKGYRIQFASQFYRNRWLAFTYPKRYGKLMPKSKVEQR